jgi:adenylosuccinate synthase
LFDDMGAHLAKVGAEVGATTGRARRCGWFDAVITRRAVLNSGITGLCITKLDVLDGLETVKMCVGYRLNGELLDAPPLSVDNYSDCSPIYEELPGWSESTAGITSYDDLPQNARNYLDRMQAVLNVSIDLISTGPDRDHTIILTPPYG